MRGIAPHFERATGSRLVFFFGTTPELIEEATSGAAFDAGVMPHEVYSDAAARARFSAAPLTEIAHVGLGLAVRAGAAKPNIATADALKTALLDATSLATIPESAAGMQITRLFERLGIADVMAAKTQVKKGPADVVKALASGETEIGMFLANVFAAPGVELVTPFPPELQQKVAFAGAVAADTPHQRAVEEFLAYLRTPDSAALIVEKGMVPA